MLVFLKLGGSLITDKSTPESAAEETIARLAAEVHEALQARPGLRLVLGHGSGSFGHTAASRYGTRGGVETSEEWSGFAEVSVVAARLNTILLEAFDAVGIPIFRVQPSASARCRAGDIIDMAVEPVRRALEHGLVPLVYGDVAFDEAQGGTIISTEDVLSYLARELQPERVLLAGSYGGVVDLHGDIVHRMTPAALSGLQRALGGSADTDVTGGMAAKVESMLALVEDVAGLRVVIFDGQQPGAVREALLDDDFSRGTRLEADQEPTT